MLRFGLLASEGIAAAQASDAIAHWRFDEGSGTKALDSSTNNHNATIVSGSYAVGRFDDALSFNGSNAYVFLSDAQGGGVTGAGLDIGTRDGTVAA